MEEFLNFSVDFIAKSMGITLEAEEFYQNVIAGLQRDFQQPDAASTESVQKVKKAKQAGGKDSSRKGLAAAASLEESDKENAADQSNGLERQDSEEANLMDASTASQRPVRNRRTKLTTLRESLMAPAFEMKRIKKEPKDKPAKAVPPPAVVVDPPSEKRKSSQDEPVESARASTESNKKVKLDDSVELIAKKPDLVELSDEEAEMMPPPCLPVPKARKPRQTKKQSSASQPLPVEPSKIKEEPAEQPPKRSTRSKVAKSKASVAVEAALVSKSQEVAPTASPPEAVSETAAELIPKVRNSSVANASSVSTETSVTTSQPVTAAEKGRSKARTKSKKPVIDKVTKLVIPEAEPERETVPEEPVAEAPEEIVSSPEVIEEVLVPKKSVGGKKTTAKDKKASKNDLSADSLYEDAENDPKMFAATITLEKISVVEPQSFLGKPDDNVNDETFVTTTSEAVVTNPVPVALAIPESLSQLDSTFNVAAVPVVTTTTSKKDSRPHDSIMTEDMSLVVAPEKPIIKQEPMNSPPRKPTKAKPTATSAKKAHEIFNPFVQSPVKAKVDAYERHVKESKIPITPKYVHVPRLVAAAASQPLPTRMRDNDTTPLKAGHALGPTASDQTGNKLAHMKKVLGKGVLSGSDSARGSSSTISSSSAKSRSNSAEDPKRMAVVLQEIAEQKKRKREEKQKLAQLNREKLEREKKEQMERLAKEREEKTKKFLQEKAEQARLEKKKQAMARLAMENNQQMKIKEMQMKQKVTQGDAPGYGWDLLRSEDSTDDEDKANKLPTPPVWSRDPLRTTLANQQLAIPSNLIDQMFGLKPMSPDLREIFPDIDPKLLKRNSSMIWKTPPRFSRMERP